MKRRLHRLRRLSLGLAALYAAASCVGCAFVNAAMFHPPKPPYGPLIRGHGPAATGDQLAQTAVRASSLPYPFDCVM